MKTSAVPISAFRPAVQAQILAQLHPKDVGLGTALNSAKKGGLVEILPRGAHAQERRLRQVQGPKLNKTEAAYLDRLRADYAGQEILVQAVTLLLANGVRYTPDFFLPPVDCVPYGPDPRGAFAYEVKGFMREDAAVKIKVAAKAYPWIRFFLVWKRKKKAGGGWASQEILK